MFDPPTFWNNKKVSVLGTLLLCCLGTRPLSAQYDPSYPEPLAVSQGTLFLHGGGHVSQEMREYFTRLAGGKRAKIIVIPTADMTDPTDPGRLNDWLDCEPEDAQLLHATSREEASQNAFSRVLEEATGVWFSGGKQGYLVSVYEGTPVLDRIRRIIDRGGIVGGTSAGAAVASTPMLIFDRTSMGFEFLPGTIIDQHFLTKNRLPRLIAALEKQKGYVGFGVDEQTALVLRGRKIEVIGKSSVTICMAKSESQDALVRTLNPGDKGDLVALRRYAQARNHDRFPPTQPKPPRLHHGTLVIAGGGRLSTEVMQRFIEAAGGKDSRIVYIPCTEEREISQEPPMVQQLIAAGAGHATWIHTKDRSIANDEAFCRPIKTATGIWFGGGRQWNLVDSYQHTLAHLEMHRLLERGGVIGGSSAGASIQGDYMPRGNPLGNLDIMAEGYETGLGFLTGVAIDQHFTQRKRLPDLLKLTTRYPQLLGIGIDEGTALLVRESTAEIVGEGKTTLIFPRSSEGAPDPKSYSAPTKIDLITGE